MPPYLWCGNWNYFAAIRNEKRNPKLEELYTKVLSQHSANLYAANGAGVVFAEKGHFDVSKDIFTQLVYIYISSKYVSIFQVWATVAELENAVRLFRELSAASSLHIHGFDEKKIDTHVEYCSRLMLREFTSKQLSMRSRRSSTNKKLLVKWHWLRRPVVRLRNRGNSSWREECKRMN
ncbi:hypothetical protein DVH24_029509 [Malus domestica]|uniref:Uncharacterized protein n=1 Tax=Malus domestica TaxID=3750 RepID=A0A498HT91_MALDO|nr:hypothetical protein DVH24_029509 [Malus domestica]